MQPKDKIKEKISIFDVVSNYVRLEKSGRQYKGRCPFHNEKTPSFYVSPERGSYHCFGCSEHGDIFSFVEKIEHVSFRDAFTLLAERAGVDIRESGREESSALLSILKCAELHYHTNFQNTAEARQYIHSRGVNEESVKNFVIGFAKNEWRDLYDELLRYKFTVEDMVTSGLIIQNENGKVYDRFRGRVMFPIKNASGATIGFTGRVLPEYDDGKSGKYVNTPETPVYHKSKVLFNYSLAKGEIAKKREVVLVEGQMDALMSYQVGVTNVIAVSGTAFTNEHVQTISRAADKVILSFDTDEAGKKARDRAAIMCAYGGLEVYGVTTVGKDPADMVKENPVSWIEAIGNKKTLVQIYANEVASMEATQKIAYTKGIVVPYLKAVQSPLERNFLMQSFSRLTGVDEEALKSEIEKYKPLIDNPFATEEGQVTPLGDKNEHLKDVLQLQIVALSQHFNKEVPSELIKLEDIADIPTDIIEREMIALEERQAVTENYLTDIINRYADLDYRDKLDYLKGIGDMEQLAELVKNRKKW